MSQPSPQSYMFETIGIQSLKVFAIAAAAELKLADIIGDELCPLDELAYATKTDADSLRRLLRALSGEGIFFEEEGGFRNTEFSNQLRRDITGSLYGWVDFMSSPMLNRCFERLNGSLTTGRPVFNDIHGCSFFDYLNRNPQTEARFAGAMASMPASNPADAIAAYDFSQTGDIVDISGHQGHFLRGILAAHPGLSGILFDRPDIIAGVTLGDTPVDERLTLAGGDFFISVPSLNDTYILRHVLHNWSDDKAIAILRNCRRAMRPDGRVLIFEHILQPANVHDYAKFFDLVLLTHVTGRERNIQEFGRLIDQAGLRLTQVVPTQGFHTIIEARL